MITDKMRIPYRSVENTVDGMARICKDFKKEVCNGDKTIKATNGERHESLTDGVLHLGREVPNEGYGEQSVTQMIEENL